MRFAVRSAPPFCYPTKRTDNSKGGIWSGSQPQKRKTRFIRACRLIFINITLSNRIVKQIIAIHGNPLHTIFCFTLCLTKYMS